MTNALCIIRSKKKQFSSRQVILFHLWVYFLLFLFCMYKCNSYLVCPLSLGSLLFVHNIFFLFCTNIGQNNALCIIISNFWVRTMDLAWDGVDTCLHNFEGNWQRRVLPYQNWSTQQNMIPEFMVGGKPIQIMPVRNLWPKFTRSKYQDEVFEPWTSQFFKIDMR